MNMKSHKPKIGGLLIATLIAVGCATGHVSEPSVCNTHTADFGTAPTFPAGTLPNQTVTVTMPSQPVSFDFSDPIKKVTDVASNLQINVTSLTISNSSHDLDWVHSVDVKIQGSAMDGSTPEAEFGKADTSLEVHVTMSGDTILHYMQSGKVTLTFMVSGDLSPNTVPNGSSLSNDVNFCLAVSGDVSKSL
jgi:hypothetical protein